MRSPGDDLVIRQAADWYAKLKDESCTDHDVNAWRTWHDSDPHHAQVWSRVEALQAMIDRVPKGMGHRLAHQKTSRRHGLLGVVGLCIGLGTWVLASTQTDWLAPTEAFVTRPGERRSVTLADGGRLLLNTNSRVVVRYGPRRRTVQLEQGELLIQTAPDDPIQQRPFVVETLHGQIRALGTRFSVRANLQYTHVAVQQHAVAIELRDGSQTLRLEAAQTASFSAGEIHGQGRAAGDPDWVEGRLTVLQQPLTRFVEELSRYRASPIVMDPSLAGLQVSGNFSLDEPERSLRAAVAPLPVRIVHMDNHTLRLVPR
jgi:transmembrane sensor